jgi:hypothetical protein
MDVAGGMLWLFLAIGAVALFSFLAVSSWADSRRREREAFYRNETLKKIAEAGAGSANALEIMREQERNARERRRDGIRLGGLINLAIGAGLIIFLWKLTGDAVAWVGLIPLFIGVAMLLHSYVLAPKA